MTTPLIERLESLLAGGKDNALLRFSLGSEHLEAEEPAKRWHIRHARWTAMRITRRLGSYMESARHCGHDEDALAGYRRGIEVAERR